MQTIAVMLIHLFSEEYNNLLDKGLLADFELWISDN